MITKGFSSVDDKMLRSPRQNSLRRWDRVCGLGHVSTSLRVPDILHKYGLSLLSTSTTSWWMERCHLGQTWYLCVHVCQGFLVMSERTLNTWKTSLIISLNIGFLAIFVILGHAFDALWGKRNDVGCDVGGADEWLDLHLQLRFNALHDWYLPQV